jgi:hypothetical protein
MFEDLLEKLKSCDHVQYETGQHFVLLLPTAHVGFSVMIEWICHQLLHMDFGFMTLFDYV